VQSVTADDASSGTGTVTAGIPPAWGELDISKPHIARVNDYWLGGKDNFASDRQLGDVTIEAYPDIVRSVQTNRAFLARTVRFFAVELGIRQFLDIGTGIPTANNTHEVAQSVAPECRIVYVDNDPIVLVHAEALLRSTPEGACDYLDCNMHDTATILARASRTLDFSQPIAVVLISILHFVDTLDAARAIVGSLLAAMAPGSGFAISHPASDLDAEQMAEMIRRINQALPDKTTLRSHDEVERLFEDYELLPPGVVRAAEWRPDTEADTELPCAVWSGVGVKR
jgi:hypothetical protein